MNRTAPYLIAASALGWLLFAAGAGARTPIEEILRANIQSDLALVRELREAKSLDDVRERLWTIENDLTQQQAQLRQ